MAKIVKLIFTKEKIWSWVEWDPIRSKYCLYTENWEKIAEHDPDTLNDWTIWMERLNDL